MVSYQVRRIMTVTLFMYLAKSIVHCQSTANNQSELIISTRVKEIAEGLSTRRINVANFDSDNRSLLEQLMAVVNEIRQRQLLQEQERQLGKLLEVKQLEMLLRQQQSNNDQLQSVVRSIANRIDHIQDVVRKIDTEQKQLRKNGSAMGDEYRHQQTSFQDQLTAAFNASAVERNAIMLQVQTLGSELSKHFDRFQLDNSNNAQRLQQQHTNMLDNITLSFSRIPELSRILIQQHYSGTTFFNRTWNEFKVGFGNVTGNYWIGNDRLHELTKYGQYKLRVELQLKSNMQWYWAEYRTFRVDDESTGYKLNIGGHSGTAGDSMNYVNGMKFSTRDRDNDNWSTNSCTNHVDNGNGGGFWYNECARNLINSPSVGTYGFVWLHLSVGESWNNKLEVTRMKLLPVN